MNPRAVLALAQSIEAEQNEGSDYDALYFGLQDIIEMLQDLVSKTTHRTARVRGHGDAVYGQRSKPRKKPKRRQTGKAKLLTSMTAPVWKKYKKGSGRKTYVQIRAQVSRSQAYKRKAKKL